ncbi:MAG: hypothetical protein K9H64_09650 [Bacteroidales bacterium]|nr:hypothetical protein [Bacteroidales bacterium]MCF8456174.1 hypothetical protein [Bacteroidales bacterium]
MRKAFSLFCFCLLLCSFTNNDVGNDKDYENPIFLIKDVEAKNETEKSSVSWNQEIDNSALNNQSDSIVIIDSIIKKDSIWILIDEYIDSMQKVLGYSINIDLPLGAEELLNHIFPKEGFIINKNNNSLDQPHLKDFFAIWNYYLDLVEISDYNFIASMPLFEFSNFISLENDTIPFSMNDNFFEAYSEIFLEDNQNFNLEFWYRLPNFKKYLAFYIAENGLSDTRDYSPFPTDFDYWWRGSEHNCYGAIIFVDTLESNAIFLPAFSYELIDNLISFQFFYITKNKEILIYEGESIRLKNPETDEYIDKFKVSLNETHIITVNKNNEIVIDNLIENDEY